MASPQVEDTLAHAEQLVNRDPSVAIIMLEELLGADVGRHERARALWIMGNAHRIQGHLDDARASLDAAIGLADGVDETLRHDARVSLAAVLISQGEVQSAERLLAETLAAADDLRTQGRSRMQLAMLRHRAGQFDVARAMYRDAVELAAAAGDELGEMRSRNNWGLLEQYVGDLDAAEEQFERALELAGAIGQIVPQGVVRHNLGVVASRRGDAREALERYEEARRTFVDSGSSGYLGPLMIDIARNLSYLGLVEEARQAADDAVALLDSSPSDLAEALLNAAHARRAAGDLDGSATAGRQAREMFVQQGRDGWVPLADLEILLADLGRDGSGEADVTSTIDALEAHGWRDEAGFARVTAALGLVRSGRLDAASELLTPVADVPHDGPAAERAVAVTASAFLAAARGETARAKRLVTAGLRELARLEQTLGALELRAHARSHGAELAQLGVDLAGRDGGARELLVRLDAQHTLRAFRPATASPTDDDLDELLRELRTVVSARRSDDAAAVELDELRRRERSIEAQIRNRSRRAEPGASRRTLPIGRSIGRFEGRDGIMYGTVDGELVAVSIRGGRCRRWNVPIDADALRDLADGVDFALHRLHRRPLTPASREAAEAALDACGAELDRALVPPSIAESTEPVVVFPSRGLYGLPWSVLPTLRGRPVTVAPSVSSWATAVEERRGLRLRRIVAVAGPELDHAAPEVGAVAALYGGARALVGRDATVTDCLAALDGADIAHFACHGEFREDNPLFSALRLADGDLTVYDLERCARLPRTVVLSACGVGQSTVLRGEALLGMASALMQLGVSSVVAPLTPVNDEASVGLMCRLHAHLADRVEPAAALALAAAGDVGRVAAPYICFGS